MRLGRGMFSVELPENAGGDKGGVELVPGDRIGLHGPEVPEVRQLFVLEMQFQFCGVLLGTAGCKSSAVSSKREPTCPMRANIE